MKLHPVYLVEPKPEPATGRRAFLVAGATFVAGLGLGGACGFAAGSRNQPAEAGTTDPTLEPTGDALLDELRALSRDGSVEELIEARHRLRFFVSNRYPNDPVLWTGIERLAEIVLQQPDCPDRYVFARLLSSMIEQSGAPSEHLLDLVPRLRSVR